MVEPTLILVAAPDAALRHSLAFALASAGFAVDAHRRADDAFASRMAHAAAGAVIDEEAIPHSGMAYPGFARFGRPIILLVGSVCDIPARPLLHPIIKPFLGEPLIDAIRRAL